MSFARCATLEDAAEDGNWSVSWSTSSLVTGSCDEMVRSFTVHSDRIDRNHEFRGHVLGVTSVSTSSTGLAVSSSLDSHIRIWNVEKGNEVSTIDAGPIEAWTVAVSADGSTIASGSQAGAINLWSVASGGRVQTLPTGSTAFAMSVALSPTGKLVACGTAEGNVFLFAIETGKLVAKFDSHAATVRALAFSADGTLFASGSDDARIALYDVQSVAAVAVLEGHGSWVLGLAFSPDSALLASCSADRSIRLWDVASCAHVQTLADAHSDQVWGVAFDPMNSRRLASVGDDCAIRIWAAPSE